MTAEVEDAPRPALAARLLEGPGAGAGRSSGSPAPAFFFVQISDPPSAPRGIAREYGPTFRRVMLGRPGARS